MILIIIQSCNSFVKDNGNISIKNGKNELISVPYECSGCALNMVDFNTFKLITEATFEEVKKNLRNPLSFNPSNITIKIYKDDSLRYFGNKSRVGSVLSINSSVYYTAKNGFGNEIEGKYVDFFYVKNGNIDRKLADIIELPPLSLEKGLYGSSFVSRHLFVSNDNFEFIDISPDINFEKDGFYLTVKSSFVDGGYGTSLTFSFDNNINFTLNANRETNEDKSISYYNIENEHLKIYHRNKLLSICIRKNDSYCCSVVDNKREYFKEYFRIKEVNAIVKKKISYFDLYQ